MDIADLSLEEVVARMRQSIPPGKTPRKKNILAILMEWLGAKVKKDMQQESLLPEFVRVLLTGGKPQLFRFEKSEVEDAFKEWQIKGAADDPANRRRYDMVQMEVCTLLSEQAWLQDNGSTSKLSGTAQEESSARVSLDESSNTHVLGSITNVKPRRLSSVTKQQKTGSNATPLGPRKTSRNAVDQQKSNEENKKATATVGAQDIIPMPQGFSELDFSEPNQAPQIPIGSLALDEPSKMNERSTGGNVPSAKYICFRCHTGGRSAL